MKRFISLDGWIGIVFCIVAALGAMLAENKRLSILEAQEATPAHVSSSSHGSHVETLSSGLRDIR